MKNFAQQKNFKITTILTFTMMTLFFSTTGFAQEFKVFNYKTLLNNTEQTKRGDKKSTLESLVSDLLPSISILNGTVNKYGEEEAISLEIDAMSFSKVADVKSQISKIEILKIKLKDKNELNSKFDLASLKTIDTLKYIYIICPFEAKESQVASLVTGVNPDVTVIYTASSPR